MSTERPLTITDSLKVAQDTLALQDPLANALAFQLALNQKMEQLLPEESRVINMMPPEIFGEHTVLPTKPVSTTSEVVFTTSGLALKFFSFRNHDRASFVPNDHGLYLMTDARVRVMSAAGEVAIGQLMNRGSAGEPLYYGLAAVTVQPDHSLLLSPLDDWALWQAVRGQQEVCIVMRKMEGSWLDLAQRVAEGTAEVSEAEFSDQVIAMLQRLLDAATPLEAAHAAELGSPARTKKTLLEDTPAWLPRYRQPHEYAFGELRAAAQAAEAAIAQLSAFFELAETPERLAERAVPCKSRDGVETAVQSYSSGDTKFGNILFDRDHHAFFSDGLSLIVKTNQVPGNPEPVFAPWAFNDILQSVAYFAIEPRYLGLDLVSARIKEHLRQYVGQTEDWTPWHELYFEALVAYKFLVEASCAVDNYIAQCDPDTQQPLPTMDAHTRRKVEEYPQLAEAVMRQAHQHYQEAVVRFV